jgi:hypothetical protein
MQAFRDALVDCNLEGMGCKGDKFMWHRGLIRERLDRALINDQLRDKFPNAILENLPYSRSDHRPMLLSLEEASIQANLGPAILRFEAKWLKETRFTEIIETTWDSTKNSNLDLAGRLSKVHTDLHRWDRSVLRSNKKRIRAAHKGA